MNAPLAIDLLDGWLYARQEASHTNPSDLYPYDAMLLIIVDLRDSGVSAASMPARSLKPKMLNVCHM
jgi:hypothetical protein